MTIAGAPGSLSCWCCPTSPSGPAQKDWMFHSSVHFGGLTSDEFSSSGDGTAVVPGWGPCLDRWCGEVTTALRCHWVELLKWGKWCTLEAPPGHFVMCIASLLSPAHCSWGHFPCMLGTGGSLAKHLLYGVWGHKRGHTRALQGCEVKALFGEEEACVSPVLCVWPVRVWGCYGTEVLHFLLDPSGLRHKWELSQHDNALLLPIPLTVLSGLSLSELLLEFHTCAPLAVATSATLS